MLRKMIVAGNKGRNVRRSGPLAAVRPNSVFSPPAQAGPEREPLSREFLRLLFRLLLGAGVVVLIASQILRWRVSRETAELERLIAAQTAIRQEHARLVAQRDELASKARIVAFAAAKLGLHLPTKEQEHRLD
ncbi:MAG: cell division protein FtsL [Candidatus Electronema sp. V4]|uniref:cell division protein FtsL n=1 Tax=Candidatus Electronema sp. V4 TaxID=3454756 RepID=UPI0040557940